MLGGRLVALGGITKTEVFLGLTVILSALVHSQTFTSSRFTLFSSKVELGACITKHVSSGNNLGLENNALGISCR